MATPTCASGSPTTLVKYSAALTMNTPLPIMLTNVASARMRCGRVSGTRPRETHHDRRGGLDSDSLLWMWSAVLPSEACTKNPS